MLLARTRTRSVSLSTLTVPISSCPHRYKRTQAHTNRALAALSQPITLSTSCRNVVNGCWISCSPVTMWNIRWIETPLLATRIGWMCASNKEAQLFQLRSCCALPGLAGTVSPGTGPGLGPCLLGPLSQAHCFQLAQSRCFCRMRNENCAIFNCLFERPSEQVRSVTAGSAGWWWLFERRPLIGHVKTGVDHVRASDFSQCVQLIAMHAASFSLICKFDWVFKFWR